MNRVALFVAVLGATGIVAGSVVSAQSWQRHHHEENHGNHYMADQCKDGGWRKFTNPKFKNQGECVAYFSRQHHNNHDNDDHGKHHVKDQVHKKKKS